MVLAVFAMVVSSPSTPALAQLEITPAPSITPSSHVTAWIFQIAIASAVLAVLVLIGFTLSYFRFAPKFSGREEKAPPLPPGARPQALTRQAAAVRWSPQAAPAAGHAAAPSAAGGGTATAVAERPSSPPAPAEAPTAEASTEAPAAAAEASTRPTAGPSGEPAVQADAVGAAEAAAPEARPTAKTEAEVGAQPEAQPAPAAAAQPAPAAAPSHGGALDQETFDRVLAEQLAKGVDRRVAEGRARAAAVVAARKKAQG
jgi:hypothetical protein